MADAYQTEEAFYQGRQACADWYDRVQFDGADENSITRPRNPWPRPGVNERDTAWHRWNAGWNFQVPAWVEDHVD